LLIKLPSGTRYEEFTMITIAGSRKRELDPPGYAPTDYELAEFFGGGSEFFPFWRSRFGLIPSFEEKDE